MASGQIGVVLMAYGGPTSIEEARSFVEAIVGKGTLSEEKMGQVVARYEAIGGSSPLVALTRKQAEALSRCLAERGFPWPVEVGMRFGRPTIAQAAENLLGMGCLRLIGLALAPHASDASTGPYRKALEAAVQALEPRPSVAFAEGWHVHPRFLEAWADSIRAVWDGLSMEERAEAVVVFTAHSLPKAWAEGSPYEAQVRETIEGVLSRIGPLPWRLAWQSQGLRGGPWLGPDLSETFARLRSEGCKTVLVVPIGFVADHVETLYDLDIEARHQAEALGLRFYRARSLNDSPAFIEALADAVVAASGEKRP